ncbi:MFS general substrate transporter [Suillus clintonianus]|uniref:MFS general substrate transporter n=1 Tax=Suillus clintonianus TaxID=1904413 RepID=UPI001B8664B2|nr:MFS general substrate transporter [Suillus clintonianus]KAG2144503.1 MFS general substrate transporter [Suillus clintonianus]
MSDHPLLDGASNSSFRYGAFDTSSDSPALPECDEQNRQMVEKRLLRKLDLRIAFLVLIYIMSWIDRTNAAAARLSGFEEDLGMTGNQFNTLMSIFYVGYLLTQTPSNMFLDRMTRPSLYLSICMAIWGAITVCMGVAQTYHVALILRFMLGFVEAAFFPGAIFLLSRWYKRNELGLRTALLACGSSLSNAFSALIASGILASLDGALGFTGWRWLFLVEGALTIVVAVSAIWILPDFPSTPSVWLLPDEQTLAKRRMEEEVAAGNEHKGVPLGGWSGLIEAITDWKVWWLSAALILMDASLSFRIFFPTLSATMGYNSTITLLLCAPPWILGTLTLFVVARHSDATSDRFWHTAGPLFVAIVGFMMAISTMNAAVRYLSLFFMAQAPVAHIVSLTWVMNTFSQSQSKRAAAIALTNALSSIGFIGSSYFWPSRWGPSYVNSFVMCILTSAMSIVMFWVFREHLSRCNEAAEAEEQALGLPKGFRYIL